MRMYYIAMTLAVLCASVFSIEAVIEEDLKLLEKAMGVASEIKQDILKFGKEVSKNYQRWKDPEINSSLRLQFNVDPDFNISIAFLQHREAITEGQTIALRIQQQFFEHKDLKDLSHPVEILGKASWSKLSEQSHDFVHKAFYDAKVTSTKTNNRSLSRGTEECYFIHGSGMNPDGSRPATTTDSGPDSPYFGDQSNFPNCGSTYFIHEDTTHNEWDDPALMKAICTFLGAPNDNDIVRGKTIITHSMGNNILGGAIMNKVCDLDAGSVKWLSASAPWLGSKAADFAQYACESGIPGLTDLAKWLNYCDSNGKVVSAYKSLSPSYESFPAMKNALPTISSRVSAALCGTSAVGLYSTYSAELELLASVVDFDGSNDGMVAVSSCEVLPGKSFSPRYSNKFYAAAVNHADGTCRNGDGWWPKNTDDRMPCKWFKTHS